jgi:hypothetical protein
MGVKVALLARNAEQLGRIVDELGDGALAEIGDVMDANSISAAGSAMSVSFTDALSPKAAGAGHREAKVLVFGDSEANAFGTTELSRSLASTRVRLLRAEFLLSLPRNAPF